MSNGMYNTLIGTRSASGLQRQAMAVGTTPMVSTTMLPPSMIQNERLSNVSIDNIVPNQKPGTYNRDFDFSVQYISKLIGKDILLYKERFQSFSSTTSESRTIDIPNINPSREIGISNASIENLNDNNFITDDSTVINERIVLTRYEQKYPTNLFFSRNSVESSVQSYASNVTTKNAIIPVNVYHTSR